MPKITIAERDIGSNCPVYIIAEACDNHLGNMNVALEMIRQAKLAGADCIKFQHHLPDEEMLPDAPMSDNFDEPLYDFLKKYALTLDQHRELKAYCQEVGIHYLCTPFSYQAAVELLEIGVDAFKIGSGEMTDLASLELIGALGKPMILSTGMSTFEEIDRTYNSLKEWRVDFALMNCVSEYPPLYGDINLGVIDVMRKRYPDIVIGHSDHSPDLFTCFASLAFGANIVEKHIILDKRQPGPDQSVSIDMMDLAQLVDGVRKIEAAMGSERTVHPKEQAIRTWAFRSIVTAEHVPAGTILTRELLKTKRPGTGIPSHRISEIVGQKTQRDIPANTMFTEDDLE